MAEWQPLGQHLAHVAQIAAEFAAPFKCADWAWNAGWLHDLGNATHAFLFCLWRFNELDDAGPNGVGGISNLASAGALEDLRALNLPEWRRQ